MASGERNLAQAVKSVAVSPREMECATDIVLAAVMRGLRVACEPRLVRERFEQELRVLLDARAVSLRHDGEPSLGQAHVVSIEVPAQSTDTRCRLEIAFGPARKIDTRTRQMLGAAVQVASLLMEIERAHGRWPLACARSGSDGTTPLVGSSHAICDVRDRIARVAATDFTILIEGESGSGKELVARLIHDHSRRRKGPFVAVNCAAIVETLLEAELFGIEERTATGVRGRRGKFEQAQDGTLFLDEVSDLSAAAQAKLLRAIQDLSVERVGGTLARRVDTRIVVATNRPLSQLVAEGRFRADLFHRLSGVDVPVPPLRHRPEDILELARHFLERHRAFRPLMLSQAAADALLAYSWPGNVRELERVIERAVALSHSACLELEDLPPALLGGYTDALVPSLRARDNMRAWGSRYARLVLERCENNKRRACRELGISYHTLQAYLRYRAESRSDLFAAG